MWLKRPAQSIRNVKRKSVISKEKCGAEVRTLRRIERDDGDTTRKENTEQAKLAASVHRRAKTDFRESSGSLEGIYN